jgi:hypothetical protein
MLCHAAATKCIACCAACFECRDDLIFLIYVYQRWIYRVDMTRVNEFGFSGAQQEEREAVAGAAEANGEPVPALEVRRDKGGGGFLRASSRRNEMGQQ